MEDKAGVVKPSGAAVAEASKRYDILNPESEVVEEVRKILVPVVGVLSLLAGPLMARVPTDLLDASTLVGSRYRIEPNIVYLSAGGWDGKLDVYLPRSAAGPVPTYLNIHGGGWVTGSKDEVALQVLPLLAMGFAVVNVDYRLAAIAPAPAAVQDCRCALRWLVRHAQQYGFDTDRVVVGGMSAGGHLALMTGMVSPAAGFDRLCPGNEDLRVAAVVNFFGIVDVADLLSGPNARDFAAGWVGHPPDEQKVARWLSPIEYVHHGGPPVLTIHGDADPVVPYGHARELANALDQAGVPNQLLTIHGGKHGDFAGEDMLRSVREVRRFLTKHRILRPEPLSAR